jgi:hypothetical protein
MCGVICSENPNYTVEYDLEAMTCWYVNELTPDWLTQNYYYGDSTTSQNLYNMLDYTSATGIYAYNFWVGDYRPGVIGGTGHFFFYGAGDREYDPVDNQIYIHATGGGGYSRQNFDFIWTCSCGGSYWWYVNGQLIYANPGGTIYGYYDNENSSGIVGMPVAWTGRGDLSIDGICSPSQSSPACDYCYIGWQNLSHGLADGSGSLWYNNYAFFIYWFYYFLAGHYDNWDYSIVDSLDMASQIMWGTNFRYSPIGYPELRSWMGQDWVCKVCVLGNPYWQPM